ncbi:MAG: DUF1801 domain-containing protein [Candidatus Marinimicrobia bacterium]|jgi:hypothetical protein|nr:DUF1801 domain-containing protein [Candidatus Neomarinimicrobiota bacterium]
MKYESNSVDEYLKAIPEDRREVLTLIRKLLFDNIPSGFEEVLGYGMPAYVVPHSIYPSGYHCDSKLPLPFINFASQKNFVAFYHMGIYAKPKLLEWFVGEYPKHCSAKLDMGKSCIRFKKVENIPFGLLADLVTKMTVDEWITIYEEKFKS